MSTHAPTPLRPISQMRETSVLCPHCRLPSTHLENRCRRCQAELPQEGKDVWRRGKRLVARRDAALPHRCVKCNGPADGAPFTRQLSYIPPWAFIFLIFWLVPFLIVALLLQKKTTLIISLCARHEHRRALALKVFIGSLIASPLLLVGAAREDSVILGWLALATFITGIVWVILERRLISATKLDEHFVHVAGVNQDFLATLPDWKAMEQ